MLHLGIKSLANLTDKLLGFERVALSSADEPEEAGGRRSRGREIGESRVRTLKVPHAAWYFYVCWFVRSRPRLRLELGVGRKERDVMLRQAGKMRGGDITVQGEKEVATSLKHKRCGFRVCGFRV